MPALAQRDAERLLRLVAEAENIGGDQPFTPELLVELGGLIDADFVSYCELDRVRRRDLFYICRPGEEDDEGDSEFFWHWVNDSHPICASRRYQDGALKLSDFLTLRELRSTRIYELWFAPAGIERELTVAIPSPMWHTKTLMFDRGRGPDFTERDRLVLDVLRPHLAHLWQAARVRRLLRQTLAELDRVDGDEARGAILLGVSGEVEFVSPPARRLLREFFEPRRAALLPSSLVAWLESDAPGPLVRRVGDRRLTVERAENGLVLEEWREEIQLTSREREVLSWVARGKTNAEIAQHLWLAPSTVRKHLENVYAKLGVSTRTAAVARFLGLLDAEAS